MFLVPTIFIIPILYGISGWRNKLLQTSITNFIINFHPLEQSSNLLYRNKKFIGFWLFFHLNTKRTMFWRMVMLGWRSPNIPIADVFVFTAPIAIINGYWIHIWQVQQKMLYCFFEAPISLDDSYFVSILSFFFHLATLKYFIPAEIPFSPSESKCCSPPCILPSPFLHVPSSTAVHLVSFNGIHT